MPHQCLQGRQDTEACVHTPMSALLWIDQRAVTLAVVVCEEGALSAAVGIDPFRHGLSKTALDFDSRIVS